MENSNRHEAELVFTNSALCVIMMRRKLNPVNKYCTISYHTIKLKT